MSSLISEFEVNSVHSLIHVVAAFSACQSCMGFKQASASAMDILNL